jgi:hypothetical protein
VSITAFSGVGAALFVGAASGVVWVRADEFRVRQEATTAIASNNPLFRRIAILLQIMLKARQSQARSLRHNIRP